MRKKLKRHRMVKNKNFDRDFASARGSKNLHLRNAFSRGWHQPLLHCLLWCVCAGETSSFSLDGCKRACVLTWLLRRQREWEKGTLPLIGDAPSSEICVRRSYWCVAFCSSSMSKRHKRLTLPRIEIFGFDVSATQKWKINSHIYTNLTHWACYTKATLINLLCTLHNKKIILNVSEINFV